MIPCNKWHHHLNRHTKISQTIGKTKAVIVLPIYYFLKPNDMWDHMS